MLRFEVYIIAEELVISKFHEIFIIFVIEFGHMCSSKHIKFINTTDNFFSTFN